MLYVQDQWKVFSKGSAFEDKAGKLFYVEDPLERSGLIKVRAGFKAAEVSSHVSNNLEFYLSMEVQNVLVSEISRLVAWVPVSLLQCVPAGCNPRVMTFAYDPLDQTVLDGCCDALIWTAGASHCISYRWRAML
jgi:hypothetical protein